MQNKTLWSLSPEPLPEGDIVGAAFVTIWFFASGFFIWVFFWLLHRPKELWKEFNTILYGTAFLCFWYFIVVIDRWLHFDTRPVVYGYILLTPFWEAFHLASTILLIWGTYAILWREIKANSERRNWWWVSAKFGLFLVFMVSFFQWLLGFSLAVVWMKFYSLNVIADVSDKWMHFELATTGLVFGFCLMIFAAATDAIILRAVKIDGERQKYHNVFYGATFLLLVRSVLQFAVVIRTYMPGNTRQDTLLFKDVSEGLLSVLYFSTMAWLAWDITSGKVQEHSVTRPVKGEVRKYILDELNDGTSHGRTLAPPFREVLDKAERNLDDVLEMSFETLNTPREEQKELARRYIRFLRTKFGNLNPREGKFFSSVENRNISAITNFTENAFGNFGRRSVSGGGTSPASTVGSRTQRRARQPSNPRLSPIHDDVVPLEQMRRTRPSIGSSYTRVPQSDTQSVNTMPLFPPPARNYGGPESGALSPQPTGNSRPAVRPMGGPSYPSTNPYNAYNPVPRHERGMP
ncbi:hypothetical protein CEP54_004783 [Fusarium duplospermum]|uniref:Uncharacterized protein n=1 Tax=Fusarium duplospermum TaxID=1325734 RepID=A0A428QGD3_9HYPO|nr:hypothetical protein CEP54_004783 [Fusarium duplospermum]